VKCPKCDGAGATDTGRDHDGTPIFYWCPTCKGAGEVVRVPWWTLIGIGLVFSLIFWKGCG
jgi:hypothetical protein